MDGSGIPRFRADVGVLRGKIAAIGRIRDVGREVLDAGGKDCQTSSALTATVSPALQAVNPKVLAENSVCLMIF